MAGRTRYFLVVDACVLIDFVQVDSSLLALVSHHVGEIHVPTPVFEEVEGVDATMAASLGIKLYEPSLQMVLTAAAMTTGRLSFQDRLCLAVVRKEGWTCVSNDKQLRAQCAAAKVPVLWEFEVLTMLVESGALKRKHASDLATKIAASNKRIGADVLARFLDKMRPGGHR